MDNQYWATVQMWCSAETLPRPMPEYKFDAVNKRRWRFDFAWPAQHLAIEIQGGVWTQGRHTRGAGYTADLEKHNAAICQGWRVLYFTPDQLRGGEWIEPIRYLLEGD